jgi:hypothetical protein
LQEPVWNAWTTFRVNAPAFRTSKLSNKDDLKPVVRATEIAARAYELYQQRVHCESQADQGWLEAEQEIRGDQAAEKKIA